METSVSRSAAGWSAPRPGSDLAERLREAGDADTCKGMFFNGVLATIGRHLPESSCAEVRRLLPEKKYVDFFNYPIATLLPPAFATLERLAPGHGGFDAAARLLGKQAIEDFLATPVGRTLVAVSGGEPRQLMRATPTAYRTAVSYGAREASFPAPTRCLLTFRRDFMPHAYHEGALLAALRALGLAEAIVTGTRVGLLDADFDVRWG